MSLVNNSHKFFQIQFLGVRKLASGLQRVEVLWLQLLLPIPMVHLKQILLFSAVVQSIQSCGAKEGMDPDFGEGNLLGHFNQVGSVSLCPSEEASFGPSNGRGALLINQAGNVSYGLGSIEKNCNN